MAELKIYGTILSRASRVIWMALELGLDYDLETVDFRKSEQKSDWFRAINPNARVPAIRDGDFTMSESLAINLYLAKKHGGPLAPKTPEDEARAVQWSLWAVVEADQQGAVLIQKKLGTTDHPPAALDKAREALTRALSVLEYVLGKSAYLLGDAFTVADLNLAGVLGVLPRVEFDLSPYPRFAAWLEACNARPAAQRVAEMRAAALAEQD